METFIKVILNKKHSGAQVNKFEQSPVLATKCH